MKNKRTQHPILHRIFALFLTVVFLFGFCSCDMLSEVSSELTASMDTMEDMEETGEAYTPATDPAEIITESPPETEAFETAEAADYTRYYFRNDKLLQQHYEKHGKEMGFSSAEAYEKAASDVINRKDALHKTEAEDGDFVYYVEADNAFVVLSTDGYIRTFFYPDAGKKYYDKQ